MGCLFCGERDAHLYMVADTVKTELCDVHLRDARRKYGKVARIDNCSTCDLRLSCCRTKEK